MPDMEIIIDNDKHLLPMQMCAIGDLPKFIDGVQNLKLKAFGQMSPAFVRKFCKHQITLNKFLFLKTKKKFYIHIIVNCNCHTETPVKPQSL